MDLNNRNFIAIQIALNVLNKENMALKERMIVLENNISNLQSELANQKQLVGHVLGRGMGSTVHNKE